jgi:hypothetical protein
MASDYLVLQVHDGTDPLNIKKYKVIPSEGESWNFDTKTILKFYKRTTADNIKVTADSAASNNN